MSSQPIADLMSSRARLVKVLVPLVGDQLDGDFDVIGDAINYMRRLERENARLRAEVEALRVDAERYRWLRDSDDCAISVNHNEHHTVYISVEQAIEQSPNYYEDVSAEEKQRMIDADSIWTVNVYPNTPVGFNVYHGATLDTAIDAARTPEGRSDG